MESEQIGTTISVWSDFEGWAEWCGTLNSGDLTFALAHFIHEIKRLDGSHYPPNTLGEIIIMIQMYLNKSDVYWKLLEDRKFMNLSNILNIMYKALVFINLVTL